MAQLESVVNSPCDPWSETPFEEGPCLRRCLLPGENGSLGPAAYELGAGLVVYTPASPAVEGLKRCPGTA